MGGSATASRASVLLNSSSCPAARPPPMSASDVRIHARYVRSLASVKRSSGSSPTTSTSGRCAIEQPEQAGLVQDRHAEALGLLELRAGALAGHEVVGLLRYRRGDAAAGAGDPLRRLLAGEVRERAGQHERLARQRTLARRGTLALELQPDRPQVGD